MLLSPNLALLWYYPCPALKQSPKIFGGNLQLPERAPPGATKDYSTPSPLYHTLFPITGAYASPLGAPVYGTYATPLRALHAPRGSLFPLPLYYSYIYKV